MQKDWITTGNAACCGIAARWLVTQRVVPAPVRSAGSGCGSGAWGQLTFVRQLPVMADPGSVNTSTTG